MLEGLFSGLISGVTARNQNGRSVVGRLQHAASDFIETETQKIQRSAREASLMLILANAAMLIAIIGVAMVLVGIAFALEPSIGQGGGFAVSGAIAILLAVACAVTIKVRLQSDSSES